MRISIFAISLLFMATHSLVGLSQTVEGLSGDSPVSSSVFPASPTTDDLISFNLTADGMTHGNGCNQLFAFGGSQFEIVVDEPSRLIQIGVTGPHSGGCLANYAPVNGLTGTVGRLAEGDWEFRISFPGSIPFTEPFTDTFSFTVEPRPVLLGDVNLDGIVSFLDISPLIVVLFTGAFQAEADMDQNGVVNFLDISGFILIFIGQ